MSDLQREPRPVPDDPGSRAPAEAPLPSEKPMLYLTPTDFELLSVIGVGSFGKVLQVRLKTTNNIYAMKVISKRLLRKKNFVEDIKVERDIMSKIDCEFVVRMHASFQTQEKLFLVMDFLAGGELFYHLGLNGILLEDQCAFYVGEIILALQHLHDRDVLHRDLKPENILLGSDGHCCITDFGLAKEFKEKSEDGKLRT